MRISGRKGLNQNFEATEGKPGIPRLSQDLCFSTEAARQQTSTVTPGGSTEQGQC